MSGSVLSLACSLGLGTGRESSEARGWTVCGRPIPGGMTEGQGVHKVERAGPDRIGKPGQGPVCTWRHASVPGPIGADTDAMPPRA